MDATISTLATGLRFPEGPVLLDTGEIVVVEIQAGRLSVWAPDGTVEVFALTGGGPNGIARARDGSLLVANNGGLSVGPTGYWFADEPIPGRIQRVLPDGTVQDVISEFPAEMARPNDLCFGPDGRLYFTDPANWEDLANLRPGRIWCADRDGSGLELLAERGLFPNGIAFAPGGTTLYVAYSISQEIMAFDWSERGLGEPAVHATLPSGFPDGMAVAADGSLVVCGSMGHVVHVFAPDGAHREAIEMPDGTEPTNCALGDGTLFMTLSGTGELVALPMDLAPLPLFD